MKDPKNGLSFALILTISLFLCMVLDAIFAGVLFTILLLFQVSIALEIAKWVFIVMMGLQFIFTIPFICHIIDEGGNSSGT